MADSSTTIQALKDKIRKFVDEREWARYHSPKNLSMNIVIEATELAEIFNWVEGEDSKTELETRKNEIGNEIADIAFGLLNLCDRYNIDLSEVFEQKLKLNYEKYPIDKCRGKREKYDQYK